MSNYFLGISINHQKQTPQPKPCITICTLSLQGARFSAYVIEHIYKSLVLEYDDPNNEVGWNSREGGWQGATVYSTMDLLESLLLCQSHDDVYMDICDSIGVDKQWCDRDPYLLRKDQILLNGWKNFCSFIKHRYRYFFMDAVNTNFDVEQPDEINPISILSHLAYILRSNTSSIIKIGKDTEIYRIRIADKGINLNTAKDLGSPPDSKAICSNRMSPAGIAMFYGALDVDTAIRVQNPFLFAR